MKRPLIALVAFAGLLTSAAIAAEMPSSPFALVRTLMWRTTLTRMTASSAIGSTEQSPAAYPWLRPPSWHFLGFGRLLGGGSLECKSC